MSAPVLVVEHEAQCPPGWVGSWLSEAGVGCDVRRPYRGDALPTDLSAHAAMVVLGGSMNAYEDDRFPWLRATKELVRAAASDGTPTLGICLGHQLLAVALGGTVQRNPRGQALGVLPLGWLPEAADDPLFGPPPELRVAVQWNDDIVTALPEGACALARTGHGEVQVARFGSWMWGVQCHPEAGADIVAAWAENDRDRCLERGIDVGRHVAEIAAAHEELRASWRPALHRFAATASDLAPAP